MGMGRKVGFDGVVFSRRIGEDRKTFAMGAIDKCAPFGTVRRGGGLQVEVDGIVLG